MENTISLKKQRELASFERAIDYISAQDKKHLNAQELSVLNNMLNFRNDEDPWRTETAKIKLPSGRVKEVGIIMNPLFQARDLISKSRDVALTNLVEAAVYLYSHLVLSHLFKEANRRTAVAALYWLCLERGVQIPAMGLLELGLGDLTEPEQQAALRGILQSTITMAQNRKK